VESYDAKKALPELYAPKAGAFTTVTVSTARFLLVDGHGDPNTAEEYSQAVAALYTLSYAVRALAKRQLGRLHTVAPLEGLWTADDLGAFVERRKSEWDWTMLIRQPEWVTDDLVAEATEGARRKPLDDLRFENYSEGLSVQVLHIGSYDDEGPLLARLHGEYLPEHGYVPRGRHHEIYLSDPRRTPPERLKTILRQPVAVADDLSAR
jgi:hypothetical protein